MHLQHCYPGSVHGEDNEPRLLVSFFFFTQNSAILGLN